MQTVPAGRSSVSVMRWAALAAATGVWAALVPYLGRALGIELPVAGSVEVVDHVVPGVAVLAVAVALGDAGRRELPVAPGDLLWSVVAGTVALAGFWITATHVPLVVEAADGVTAWGTAVWHTSAGPPALVAGLAMLVLPLVRRP